MKKFLTNQLGLKFTFILFLFLLLQIPMSMIHGLISERDNRQSSVQREIAKNSSGEQQISGPFIHINYTDTSRFEGEVVSVKRSYFILPETFNVNAHLDSFEKYRGIYKARLYNAQTELSGQFDLSSLKALSETHPIDNVSLAVMIQDSRGLLRLNEITINNDDVNVEPGTQLNINQMSQGFHSIIDISQLSMSQPLLFNMKFLLQGMGQLMITPIGKQTNIELLSSWAHPSFVGDYLPIASEITEQGFSAKWVSNYLSTNINQLFEQCISHRSDCRAFNSRQMGVSLIDPVDHYLKSERSINYSLLVSTLVFAGFFLLEIFQARPIHPIQYGFVGLALAVFYLLLISVSEHIGFDWAYVLSALSASGLLGVYVGGFLNGKKGLMFSIGMIALYGLLFGLLQAESYALLMGTLLCFAILSFIMLLTRNINWYEKSANSSLNKPENESEVQSDIKANES